MVNFILEWLKTAVEVPALLLFFAFTITETTTYNIAVFRVCFVGFGYNRSVCERVTDGGDADDTITQIRHQVQPYAMDILMAQQMITQIAPALLVIFLGPWSDKHGRRPVLIVNMIGFCAGGVFAVVVSSVETLSAWWFMGSSLLIAIFGGVTPFLTAIMCYISDITTEENRGFRMGIFQGVMTAGTLVGTVVTTYILSAGGYITVYAVATSCFFLAFFFNIFIMVDSLPYAKDKGSKFDVFSVKNFKEIMLTVISKKRKSITVIIILAILTSALVRFVGHSDASAFYMFMMGGKYNWNLEKYNLFIALRYLLGIIVTVGAITVLHKKWNVREIPLIVIGSVTAVATTLLQGWAIEDWHMYLAAVISSFSGVLQPMIRSFISKLVTPEDTGKLFSVTMALESLVLLGGIPLYKIVYNNTVETNAGAFNFLTAGLYGLLLVFAVISMLVQKFRLAESVIIEKKYDESSAPSNEKKSADAEAASE